ncbi:hypothetical protein BpHYR1_010543 [Brachionus plicatilis]|uniref:Uncharacterized protein n=1 Tax=Brachionus plicatilis TaxID=10195 RepID=A0A3M7T8A2_BRAPC|nr:hypothetical protein BpHYR1_010543 [Brachionus plicatilis]
MVHLFCEYVSYLPVEKIYKVCSQRNNFFKRHLKEALNNQFKLVLVSVQEECKPGGETEAVQLSFKCRIKVLYEISQLNTFISIILIERIFELVLEEVVLDNF